MKQPFRSASLGVAITLVLGLCAALSPGCGAIDANVLFGLETCDILNCDGLFFGNLADDHDDMDGMDDADAHDDNGDDDHMDDMDDHDDDDDAEAEEHDDVAEDDGGSGTGVARS